MSFDDNEALLERLSAEVWAIQRLLVEKDIVSEDELRVMTLRGLTIIDQAQAKCESGEEGDA